MKKTNDKAASYSSPKIQILDIRSEGLLCLSYSSAVNMTLGDPLKEYEDYEQIF